MGHTCSCINTSRKAAVFHQHQLKDSSGWTEELFTIIYEKVCDASQTLNR